MSQSSRADLGHAFCSYCGYPPTGRWWVRADPKCSRCQLGSVLRTVPGSEPHFDEPFVIVDQRLTVQSISQQAGLVLLVSESHGCGAPLDAFLVSDCVEDDDRLVEQIAHAVTGTPVSQALELRTAGEPEVRFQVRVSSCGPPAAALLVLTPVPTAEASSANKELVRLVCALDDARRGLSRVAGEDVPQALETVAEVRLLLEQVEQGFLALSRQRGLAAPGLDSNVSYLFPRSDENPSDAGAPPDALPRHVRRRRSRDGPRSRPSRRGE